MAGTDTMGLNTESPARGAVARSARFIALAYVLSWSVGAVLALAGGGPRSPGFAVGAALSMFGPLVAAVLEQRRRGEPVFSALGVRFRPNRWFLVAAIAPVVLALAAFAVALARPGVSFTPDFTGLVERFAGTIPPEQLDEARARLAAMPRPVLWALMIVQPIVLGATVNAVAAFGEELGWRGFLQREAAPLGFWRASLFIGVVWGLWHAPLILQGHNYPEHPVVGVAMMTLFCVLLTPIIAFVRERSGSVVAAAIFHGVINASAGLAYVALRGGSDLVVGLTGASGLVTLALVDGALWLALRRTVRNA